MMTTGQRTAMALAALMAWMPATLSAHRQWMLPSSTVLSNSEGWVTIDAAVSNELFYFDHVPLRITNNLKVTSPDGTTVAAENQATGKYRTTFDLHLTKPGTYRVALVNNTVFASWKVNGESKTWRGTAEAFKTEVPAGAEGLQSSRMSSRVELFVTAGKPSTQALEPTGVGLEMKPITHPNDLVVGEAAKFQMLQDGKPAPNLDVTLISGGIRYRDQLGEIKVKTDAEGKFALTFKTPGMYWMNATSGTAMRGQGGPGGGGGGMRMPPGDRANYVATLEVLPQ